MPTPINLAGQDLVVVQHRWRDTRTLQGVDAKVRWEPRAFSGDGTPNLTYFAGHEWFKTRGFTTTPDYDSGYMAVPLPPTDDLDLTSYVGVRVTPEGETPVTVEVPANAPLVTVTAEMRDYLASLDVPFEVTTSQQVRAVWLTELAITSPAPTPPSLFWSVDQTTNAILDAIDVHDQDSGAHADLRTAITNATIPDATTTVKGKSQLLGGTADNPSVPWTKVTGAPTSFPPSGGAGGVLSGTYPNPGFASDMAYQAELDAVAASIPEVARDTLGAALVAGTGVTITPNDGADTITISSTASSGTTVPTRLTSSNTTAVPGELLIVNATGGQRTITPPASPALGTFVTLLKSDASTNYVVWDGPTNSDTSAGLVRQWAGATFTWTGTVWAVTSANLTSGGGSNDRADHTGTQAISTVTGLQTALDDKAPTTALAAHTGDLANPHAVTKAQVGLGNVANTAPADLPVSTAAQAALDLKANASALGAHTGNTNNPHSVTKAQVGLGNADNTADVDKPVSTATQSAIDAKTAKLTQRSSTATANTTAAASEIVPLDTTGGTFTLTGPSSGASFGARWKAGTATPTITAPVGYTISGAASIPMGLAPGGSSGELVVWQAFATDYQPISGFKPQTALAAVFDTKGAAAAAQAAALARNAAFVPTPAVGEWINTGGGATNGQSGNANGSLWIGWFYLPGGTYDQGALVVGVAGSAGAQMKAILFSDSGGRPGTLLLDGPTVDATSTGTKSFAASFSIAQGGALVWGGVVVQGAPTTLPQFTAHRADSYSGQHVSTAANVAAASRTGFILTGVTGAAPSTFGAATRNTDVPFGCMSFRRSA